MPKHRQPRTDLKQLYDPDVSFREEQRMHPLIVWIPFIVSPIITTAVLYYVFFLRAPTNEALSVGVRIGLIVFTCLWEIVVTGWLLLRRLITEVRYDSLSIQFQPFTKRMVAYGEITTVEPRTCNVLAEFGGYGARSGKNGKAYILLGNQGVQLELRNGERVFVGSRKAGELAQAIKDRMR
jgi:hypothetical protein